MTAYNTNTSYMIKVYSIIDWQSVIPYNNVNYGITDGTLTLTSGDIVSPSNNLVKIDDAIQRINISKGGNLANGYSFVFEITNYGFIQDVLSKGVFFKNLKTELYIYDGAIFNLEWTGIIDSIKVVKEQTVKFNCVDPYKDRTETIGSDTLPIALNRNYNCKLVETEELEVDIINRNEGLQYKDVPYVCVNLTGSDTKYTYVNYIEVNGYDSGDYLTAYDNQFYGGYIYVSMGEGAGESFNINSVVKGARGSNFYVYRFYVDGDVSILKGLDTNEKNDISVVGVRYKKKIFNLSSNKARTVHSGIGLSNRKGLAVIEDSKERILSLPNDYVYSTGSGVQTVTVNNISENDEILTNSSQEFTLNDIVVLSSSYVPKSGGDEYKIRLGCPVNKDMLNKMADKLSDGFDLFLDTGVITLKNFLKPSHTTENVTYTVGVNTTLTLNYPWNVNMGDGYSTLITTDGQYAVDNTLSGKDLILSTTSHCKSFKDVYQIEKAGKNGFNGIVNLFFDIYIQVTSGEFWAQTPDAYEIANNVYNYENNLKIENLSIGCSGENVESGNDYESVCDTIKYIQTEKMRIALTDIDLASYLQADADFDLLNPIQRNPAHQITEQTDANTILKDILFAHHLGMYFSRVGKYTIKNWLPNSYIFNQNATPDAVFDDTNCIEISDIKRDDLNNVVSDFELKYDYNEATGEYQGLIRIKNTTNSDTFSLENSTEGVSSDFSYTAEKAWESAQRGWKRIRKESQTKHESKWIKAFNADGTNENEAINFIRNQLAHVNREHEYISISVPFSATNLSLELLSFIQVTDAKITDGVARKGWIVERKINTKRDFLEFKILLDIISTDPFIIDTQIIQDVSDVSADVLQDDSSAVDIVQDGDGEQ